MKVLMISGDANLLKNGSAARERLALQADAVDQLDVFVWPSVHSAFAIWRATRQGHYDVITAQDPFWRGLLAWKVARLTGTRLNLQLHADLKGQSLVKHVLGHIMLRHADSVRVVSERIKKEVEAIGVRAPVTVLPVFIDAKRVEGITRAPHPRFAKTILWVGRFEREKDPLRAISVLKEVRANGVDAGLVMLGSGSLQKELRAAAEGLPVDFPGWQDDPKKYLAMADAVLSTSPYESYGASIVEALAAGVPVVSLDVGVARDAGAHIAEDGDLARAVGEVLASGGRGQLKLSFLSAEDWAKAWRNSL
jgi:glycosyltransferase involved in cell wall biosynthesis